MTFRCSKARSAENSCGGAEAGILRGGIRQPKAKADTSTGKRKVDHLSMVETVRTGAFIEARTSFDN
jgi:hypothetical protein